MPETPIPQENAMNPAQIQLVQDSFAKVAPIAPVAADLFYARLFEIDPSLKSLFKGDLKRQGAMLMSMIATAVRSLSNPEGLIPVLRGLGQRHAAYGVTDAHYATVATALIWTLEQGLGADFTPAVREAWVAAYELMADTMMQAAHEMPLRAAA
jgi:hemoglobin-like flavoprotein